MSNFIHDIRKYNTGVPLIVITIRVALSATTINTVVCLNIVWYGFCNDQYQFSKLQELIALKLDIETGTYYHFAHNMHLYKHAFIHIRKTHTIPLQLIKNTLI